jgi:formylglycine-generating enzyme required for sulfatase activity
VVGTETCLVLVLLPGGRFLMGAQPNDPEAPNRDLDADVDESPVHEVELSAFFLSKYEMTQGQWLRFTGSKPSHFGSHNYSAIWNPAGRWADLSHPVGAWTDTTRATMHAVLAWTPWRIRPRCSSASTAEGASTTPPRSHVPPIAAT